MVVISANGDTDMKLTGNQIFLLMQASRNQYVSMDTNMVCRGYKDGSDRWENPQILFQYDIISRWKRGWSYGHSTETIFDDFGKKMDISITQYNINPSEIVCLRKSSPDSIPEVSRDTLSHRRDFLDSLVFEEWNDLVWIRIGLDEDSLRLRMETANISWDQITEQYIVEFARTNSPKATIIRWRLDPLIDFLPVTTQLLSPDKQLLTSNVCSDWYKLNNKWIPRKIIRHNILAKFAVEYSFQTQSVNQPMSDALFSVEIPTGSIVDDRIRNVRYKYTKADLCSSGSQKVESIIRDVDVGNPSSDLNLADAAIKGEALFIGQKSRSLIPVQVALVPTFVWVLPGSNKYTLELSQEMKTKPSLSGKTFSDSPLVLHGVDDQLASSGKIIVTLERPEGHKDFVDAILTLDFGGMKTPIHFVAAPLSE